MNEYESNLAALPSGEHYEPEDLLLYILNILSPAERAAVDAHLGGGDIGSEDRGLKGPNLGEQAQQSVPDHPGGCPQCRGELAAVRETIGSYAVAVVEGEPLASPRTESRERLLKAAGQPVEAAAPAAGGGEGIPAPLTTTLDNRSTAAALAGYPGATLERRKGRGATAAAWIGWATAAALAVTATHFYQQSRSLRAGLAAQQDQIARLSVERARAREVVSALTDRGAQRVTLSLAKSSAPPQPSARATYLASKGTLIFLASHLDPLPAGKTYELWVIPASGAAPVPAGTFRPDERGNANVVTARLEGTGAAKALGVTIEAAGGSSTPTLPILLAGS